MIETCIELLAYAMYYTVYGAWRALPLLAVVLLVDLTLRRRIAARFHCVLWALVMIRMLCPVSAPSALSIQGHHDRAGESALTKLEAVFAEDEPVHQPRPLVFDTFTFVEENGEKITLPILPNDATDEYRAEAEAYIATLNPSISDTGKYDVIEADQLAAPTSPTEYRTVSVEPVGDPQFGLLVWDWETIIAFGIFASWVLGVFFLLLRSTVAHIAFSNRLRKIAPSTNRVLQSQLLICLWSTACWADSSDQGSRRHDRSCCLWTLAINHLLTTRHRRSIDQR